MNNAYGAWSSPISGAAIASGISLRDVQWDSASETLVWWENRGKTGVLQAQTGRQAPRDLTDSALNVAGRVGYGGGAFTVLAGTVVFAANGRLHAQSLGGGASKAIAPAFGSYAAPAISPDGKWVAFAHSYENVDGIAIVDIDGESFPRKLAFGTDFVMQPSWHPEGRRLAFVAWDHPQMPWTGSELRLATLELDASGMPFASEIATVAGDAETAVFQPEFSPDGRSLAYISDASGWNQLYLYDLERRRRGPLTSAEAEHGTPAWAQGMRVYGWAGDGRSICYLENRRGFYRLMRHDLEAKTCVAVDGLSDYAEMGQLTVSRESGAVGMIASSSLIPSRVLSLEAGGQVTTHRRSATENLRAEQLSEGRAIEWTGDDGGAAHGIFYPPVARDESPPGLPPLIVNVHGGPTSQRSAGYANEVQFFTTRGYAVLQVNHRGSTGYGRAYMDMHRGNWGVYDVSDSAAGLRHLAREGTIDADKAVIMGGSAGGFTVLQSLIDLPGLYKAGVCSYGVSNQFALLMDTHKFEARYLDWLLGELPEAAELYRQRSPAFHADKIVDPLIVFQGSDDAVVPQDQSEGIVASLKRRGVPHEYHLFAGEGHGWRKPETIKTYYEKIDRFLLQHVVYA